MCGQRSCPGSARLICLPLTLLCADVWMTAPSADLPTNPSWPPGFWPGSHSSHPGLPVTSDACGMAKPGLGGHGAQVLAVGMCTQHRVLRGCCLPVTGTWHGGGVFCMGTQLHVEEKCAASCWQTYPRPVTRASPTPYGFRARSSCPSVHPPARPSI